MSKLRRFPHSVVSGAVTVARTGQDQHDRPLGGFTVGTLELHQSCLGSVGGAASAVCAGATVAWFVGLDTGAVLMGEVGRCVAPDHPLALAASLKGDNVNY